MGGAGRGRRLHTARADELDVASGSNTVISRQEQAAVSADLHGAAEEVRRRDPGGLVTVREVAAVVGERLEPVLVGGTFAAMPSGDDLARALGHDPATDTGFVERFRRPDARFLDELRDSNGSTSDAKAATDLLRGLADLRVLIVGKDGGRHVSPNHPTYVVGRAQDGAVVGFKTGVIWT